jgi:glyoxylase-like metal-dependent hydrolase (beta-lactamase superfamily II)/rhodanese-related sulfurtransferase
MIFRQLIDSDLGCAAYLLGDEGRAVVVDPGLDVERIVAAAEEEKVTIELIVETHVHADHVSGRALLAARTGAAIRLPADAGYDDGAGEPLRDSETVELGALRITALAAPGHRPEHTILLVSDRSRSDEPWLLLSGDSLLVGDLARPDLAVDPADGAAALHATLARIAELPAGVELWPGHVGGSLCGGPGLSRKTSSTLGFERRVNPLLSVDADELAQRLMASLPARPPTVEAVVARNRGAAPGVVPRRGAGAAGGAGGTGAEEAQLLDAAGLAAGLADGATLLDGRAVEAFDAAHVRGSLSLALRGNGLGTRAAWVLDPAQALVVLADDEDGARELARRLRAVGLDDVRGLATAEALEAVPLEAAAPAPGGPVSLGAPARAGLPPLEAVAPLTVQELARQLADGAVTLVDVRDTPEWGAGHLAHGVHLPLQRLRAEAGELPAGPLAIACASGPRAAFAASWLRAQGHDARRVADGGVPDLPALGHALVAA